MKLKPSDDFFGWDEIAIMIARLTLDKIRKEKGLLFVIFPKTIEVCPLKISSVSKAKYATIKEAILCKL